MINKALRTANQVGNTARSNLNLIVAADAESGFTITTVPQGSQTDQLIVMVPAEHLEPGDRALMVPGRIIREMIAFSGTEDLIVLSDQCEGSIPEAPNPDPDPDYPDSPRYGASLYYADKDVRARINASPIEKTKADDLTPEDDERLVIKLPGSILRRALNRVECCREEKNSERASLTGVCLDLEGQRMTCATADGFRLAVQENQVEDADYPNMRVLLPPELVRLLRGTRLSQERDIELRIPMNSENEQSTGGRIGVVIASDNQQEITVTGSFASLAASCPNYQGLVPEAPTHNLSCELLQLRQAVNTVSLVARQSQSPSLHIAAAAIDPAGNREIQLASHPDPEVGQANSFITAVPDPGDASSREPVRARFNNKFIEDLVSAVDDIPNMTLHLNSPSAPAAFSTTDGYQQVIMPIPDTVVNIVEPANTPAVADDDSADAGQDENAG